MGKYPFVAAANLLLEDTAPFYAESTQKERRCKFRRIYKILCDLKEKGIALSSEKGQELRVRISTSNPRKISERDVEVFLAWCQKKLDASTASKYLRFLEEVLLSVGNNSVRVVRLKRKSKIPKPTQKPIRTIPSDTLEKLLWGMWDLEDAFWNSTARAAIALYSHSGLRPSELRYAKLVDLNLSRSTIVVSHPKGHRRWASGEEDSPIMPGVEVILEEYLENRALALRRVGLDPGTVEPLFPYICKNGKAVYWNHRMWSKLKCHVQLVTETRFRWKDMRPTFAQRAKDAGAPIEVVSKALRHTDTRTTEGYYARIRSETAFSQLRQAWEAAAATKS
jgi:integrase